MKKLFEIPIYAFNRKVLYKREEKVRQEVWNGHEGCPKEHINAVAAAATYPACLWDYNHIVCSDPTTTKISMVVKEKNFFI